LLDPDPYIIYGSGSRRANNIRIRLDPDPDPQHCQKRYYFLFERSKKRIILYFKFDLKLLPWHTPQRCLWCPGHGPCPCGSSGTGRYLTALIFNSYPGTLHKNVCGALSMDPVPVKVVRLEELCPELLLTVKKTVPSLPQTIWKVLFGSNMIQITLIDRLKKQKFFLSLLGTFSACFFLTAG